MFIICGKDKVLGLRVLDTSDNTVEFITAEQLKVVQQMGYSIKVDESMDYIFKLYSTFPDSLSEIVKYLSNIKSLDLSHDYVFQREWYRDYLFYLLACDSSVILLSVGHTNNVFKMYINPDIREKMGNGELDMIRLSVDTWSNVSILYNLKGKEQNRLIFNGECELKRNVREGY